VRGVRPPYFLLLFHSSLPKSVIKVPLPSFSPVMPPRSPQVRDERIAPADGLNPSIRRPPVNARGLSLILYFYQDRRS